MNIKNGFLLLSSFKLAGFCLAGVFILSLTVNKLIFAGCVSLAVFLATLKVSLKKAPPSSVEAVLGPLWGSFLANQEDDKVKGLRIIAHRACGLDAPENSIAALKNIIREGIKAVEFDVMLTADKVPVVFHDDILSRVVDSGEMVKNVTWDELQKMDLSKKHPFGKFHPNEKIPSMDAFVRLCLESQTSMLIDLKDLNLVPYITGMFEKYPELVDKALVSSFDPMVIYKIRQANHNIVGCLAWRPFFYTHAEYSAESGAKKPYSRNPLISVYRRFLNASHQWFLWNFIYHVLGLSAILLHKDMITRGVIQHWKKRDVRVLAWTVNSPAEKIFFERVLQIPYLTDTLIAR